MKVEEKIYLASKFAEKGWDYETCYYGDDLYGQEEEIDEIWEYVLEFKEIGRKQFKEKYSQYKLY
jgi:hypothetical protein